MIKHTANQIAYYFAEQQHYTMAMECSAKYPSLKPHLDRVFDIQLMQFATFAVNTRTNELLKCRTTIEHLLDKICLAESEFLL